MVASGVITKFARLIEKSSDFDLRLKIFDIFMYFDRAPSTLLVIISNGHQWSISPK